MLINYVYIFVYDLLDEDDDEEYDYVDGEYVGGV